MVEIAAGMPPPNLYKFRGFDKNRAGGTDYEWDRSIIIGCSLWAGSPLGFNDPFDCYPTINFEGTRAEKEAWAKTAAPKSGLTVDQAVEGLENALGDPASRSKMVQWRENLTAVQVLCLTERPDDMLMWAHYADSHHGYCLELDATIPPLSSACQVEYAVDRPAFRLFDPYRVGAIMSALLRKADFWQHESEWRMVGPAGIGPVVFPPQALKSIILGAGMGEKDEENLRAIANERELPVAFKRARLDEHKYLLEIIDA